MKALGMIEVYGYVAAVEALDSALKAANVEAVEVTKVQGGLVAVLVSGDVGATRAAISAASAAASRVGRVISTHVIPMPAEDTKRLFGENRGAAAPDDEPVAEPREERKSSAGENTPPAEPAREEPEETADNAKNAESTEKAAEEDALADIADSLSGLTEEAMRGMTVAALRSAARALKLPGMTKQEIRFAKKEELISVISAFLEQGR